MASLEEVRQERIEKLETFRSAGGEAYPIEAKVTHRLAEVGQNFNSLIKAKKLLTVAGRVMGKRGQGAISFLDLDDGTARLQAFFSQENFKAKDWQRFSETVDLGDFIEVRGELFLTKQKAQTIAAKDWRLLTKSLRPLPDKWHGLENVEERFRRRYLDTLVNPEVKARFILRSRLISALRAGLEAADYLEVETPILQPLAGGASALPFRTHHEALDLDLYLRISPELYLKQMLVGGFARVYEFARDFRNEGIDATHHPEFTVLEFYEAYSDAKKQMIFVERLLRGVIKTLNLKQPLTYNDATIDFRPKFKVVSYFDLLKKYALISDPAKIPLADLTLKANQLAVPVEGGAPREKILDAIYKKVCRPKLIAPTFIIDYPRDYLPLAKAKPKQPELADAFQLVVGGLELVKAFSELNDPLDQAERFRIQDEQRVAGDAEAQASDQHFIEALEYGLPPAGGVGVGIDRLVMLLTGATNIREVIYFPTLRPKVG